MSALLSAELLKLRTTRTFLALVASALAISLLITVLVSAIADDFVTADDARELLTIDFTSLFVLLLGAIGITGEWRHRTITSSVLAAPDRVRLLIAKVLAYAAAGVVLSLVVTVAVAVVSTAILSVRDLTTAGFGDLLDALWRNLVVAAVSGALGVAVGALVRNQIVAVIGLILIVFALEPTLSVVVPEVDKFSPFGGAVNAIIATDESEFFETEELLSPGLGLLVTLAWLAVLSAAGALLLRERDLT